MPQDRSNLAYAVITPHAREEMTRRHIPGTLIGRALRHPDQVLSVRTGRVVVHSLVAGHEPGRPHLLRVFVDVDRLPPEVVTAYLTSKVAKYWSKA